jgi:hypothetical protein
VLLEGKAVMIRAGNEAKVSALCPQVVEEYFINIPVTS